MGRRLFVGNLNFETTGDDLKELFSKAGTCESAVVMSDRATGRSRGFGFVEMSTEDEAKRAIQEFDTFSFQGRNLNVNEARERSASGPPRGPSYAPSYGFDFGGGGGGGAGGYRSANKPRKDGGSRRGLRAKKRSL
jgi:cold-inducible RNA-binding protein